MSQLDEILFDRFLSEVLQSRSRFDEQGGAVRSDPPLARRRTLRVNEILDLVTGVGAAAQLTEGELRTLRNARPRRRSLSDVETILDLVSAGGGTGALTAGEVGILGSRDSREAIVRRLRETITATGHLDRRLWTLFSPSTSSELLVSFLLVVLHCGTLAALLRMNDRQFVLFRAAAALSTITIAERIPRRNNSEHSRKQKLLAQIRAGSLQVARINNAIVANTAGFSTTHQRFVHHYLIDPYLEKRVEWQLSKPLTAQERQLYASWQTAQGGIVRINEIIARVEGTIVRLVALHDGTRVQDIRALRADLRGKRRERKKLERKVKQLERRLGTRLPQIASYMARESSGDDRADPIRRERCQELLMDLDRALLTAAEDGPTDGPQRLTDFRLWRDELDDAAWARYGTALEKLLIGEGTASLEFMVKPYLEVYGSINRNRDIGLHRDYTGGTYTGHPENAVDINTQAKSELFVSAPTVFRPPGRLFANAELAMSPRRQSRSWEEFRYRGSVIPEGGIFVSTDLQDIFGKLTYLLPPRTPAAIDAFERDFLVRPGHRFSEAELAIVMQVYESQDLAPRYLSLERAFDVQRIMSGLAFANLTDTPDAREFDETRQEIFSKWEQLIAEELRVPGVTLFDPDLLYSADVGVPRLVTSAHARQLHDQSWRDVARAALSVLCSEEQSANDYEHFDGLLHMIWRLLIQLYSTGNVDLHHKGQSVNVEQAYASTIPNQPDLIVHGFYTHLYRVDPSMRAGRQVGLGALLGQVGETGNAFTPHLHIELKLSYAGRPSGTMLPHEFFPVPN